MLCNIIDGKQIARDVKNEVKTEVARLNAQNTFVKLAVILAGDDAASKVYVRNKARACEECDIASATIELPESVSQDELLKIIAELNADNQTTGILVQLPLPRHLDTDIILKSIDPTKDVDCSHPYNAGLLSIGKPIFTPCTPAGVIEILKRSGITIAGKNCVVIGRSNLVGKPMAAMLLSENATVTVCHSKTADLKGITKTADILIAAMRCPRFITGDMIKKGAVVIDVGIHRIEGSNKLCGDVDFDSAVDVASFLTPVPGGVGPMTIAMLMSNCAKAARQGGK